MALSKRIPEKSAGAETDRNMVVDFTLSIDPTKSWAWIQAFSCQTCPVQGTVGINLAFWSAVRRLTNHARETVALATIVDNSCICILSTWVWLTRILVYDGLNG